MVDLRVPVVALLVVALSLSPVTGVVGANDHTVTVTVAVEDRDGDPVSDADLRVTWNDSNGSTTATTFSNGKTFVDVPAGANVTIEVSHPDYVRNVPYELTNATGREVTVGVAEKGRARVTVRDDEGPLENARVQLYRNGTYVVDARTNADGVLRTGAIEQGEYTLTAFKQGYRRNQSSLVVDEQVNRTVEVERGSVLVTFNVTDDHFSPARPVGNATVSLERLASVTTLPGGTVTVSSPVNTRLSVSVTKDGYERVTKRPFIAENERTIDVQINRRPSLSIEAANTQVVVGQTVRVTVTDEYGQPVANATVSTNGSTVGTTDARGVVAVPVASAGNVTITASKGSLESSTTVEGVESGGGERTATTTTDVPTTTGGTTASGSGFTAIAAAVVVVALLAVAAIARSGRR